MAEVRMISKQSKSMVYHRPECRYARKIMKRNRVQVFCDEAKQQGYRPCKCCDKMKFLYTLEKNEIEYFAEKHNMNVDMVKDELVIRTDAGCWKILYKKRKQKFMLLHRNYVPGRISLKEIDNIPYHLQGDMLYSKSIIKFVKYIQAHDKFKANPVDYHAMPRSTNRQRAYYYSAKRREEKRSARRLDNLFLMIENKEGIRNLSFC